MWSTPARCPRCASSWGCWRRPSGSTPSVMPSSTATRPSSLRSPDQGTALAVELRDVSKRFYFYEHRTTSLREWFIRRVLHRPLHIRRAEFSLQDVDLRVDPGEAVALLGANASGKSTVLRLIARIYQPSSGG